MKEEYYFSFDEPDLHDKNIICTFYISNIDKKRSFFFIVDENDELVIYYAMIGSSDMMRFIKEYGNSVCLDENLPFKQIFELSDFIEKYKDKYLQYKILDNPYFVRGIIDKISKDSVYNAKNEILGLDGFSVELKLNKEDEPFYAWCSANDKKYFYVLDFINSILDELGVNIDYRFEKIE